MKDMKINKIAIGSDHGGFPLKEELKAYLSEKGYVLNDCGTHNADSVDYPKYAFLVAQKVSAGDADIGIIVDGAGIGSAMTANKVSGVRAAMCYDISTARNAREHNDANVLTLGGALLGFGLAKQIIDIFTSTFCIEDRHKRRVTMIDELDSTNNPSYSIADQKKTNDSNTEAPLTNLSQEDLNRVLERVKSFMDEKNPETHSGHSDSDMVCVCGVCTDRQPDTLRYFRDSGVDRFGYHDATAGEGVPEDIAACIDHTVLKPGTTENDIVTLCKEAREYNFATVCISPVYVALAHKELSGSKVKVCTVVGFPHGANLPEIKALETRRAIRDGAEEIDMVINIGALKSGDYDLVYRDIRMVCEACEDGGALSKVIIEAAMLSDEEKIKACEIAKKAKANYVKTSTGFGPHGATAEDVELMRNAVGAGKIGVKAAGGIRSYEDAKKMISAGATRIGASAGIKILQQAKEITVTE